MNLTTIATAVSTVAGILSNFGKIKEFVTDAVKLAESVAADGPVKLTAVLAATKAFVSSMVAEEDVLEQAWAAIKDEVTAFVNGTVALWKSLGVFATSPAATPAAS